MRPVDRPIEVGHNSLVPLYLKDKRSITVKEKISPDNREKIMYLSARRTHLQVHKGHEDDDDVSTRAVERVDTIKFETNAQLRSTMLIEDPKTSSDARITFTSEAECDLV